MKQDWLGKQVSLDLTLQSASSSVTLKTKKEVPFYCLLWHIIL